MKYKFHCYEIDSVHDYGSYQTEYMVAKQNIETFSQHEEHYIELGPLIDVMFNFLQFKTAALDAFIKMKWNGTISGCGPLFLTLPNNGVEIRTPSVDHHVVVLTTHGPDYRSFVASLIEISWFKDSCSNYFVHEWEFNDMCMYDIFKFEGRPATAIAEEEKSSENQS